MAMKIIEEHDKLEIDALVGIIFGDPGMGKSTLSMQAEGSFLMDFDDGLKRAIRRKRAGKVDTFQDFLDFIASPDFDKMEIKNLICDTGGTMLDNYMAEHVIKQDKSNEKKGGGISLQGYGAMKDLFRIVVNRLKAKKINITFVCHTETFKDGEHTRFRPKMTGGSYDILMQVADFVGFMESRGDKRTINFDPTDRSIGKNAPMFPLTVIPNEAEPEFENFWGKMFNQAKEKMESMSEEQQQAIKLLDEYRGKITDAMSVSDIETLSAEIEQLKPIYKGQLMKQLKERYYLIIYDLINKVENAAEVQILNDKFNNELDVFKLPAIVKHLKTKLHERMIIIDCLYSVDHKVFYNKGEDPAQIRREMDIEAATSDATTTDTNPDNKVEEVVEPPTNTVVPADKTVDKKADKKAKKEEEKGATQGSLI